MWFCGGFCLKVMLFPNLVSDLICQVHVFLFLIIFGFVGSEPWVVSICKF
jgi:hypothetical protein